MRKIFFILVFALLALKTGAQLKRPFIVEARVHSGMMLPFYEAIAYLIEDDMSAFEINLSFPTYGNDFWEKMFRYPRGGIGYSNWYLGNNEVFGKAHALYGFINVPLFMPKKRFSLNYQISFGAAYLTRRFDIETNYLNRAISSHGNVYIQMGLDSKIRIFPRSEVVLAAGGSHFSNGKTRSPNYGINAGTVSVGINYLFGNPSGSFGNPEVPVLKKRFVQTVFCSAGTKVYDNLLGKRYFVSSFTYNYEYLLNFRRRIGLGADLFYDGAIKEALADENGNDSYEAAFTDLLRFGFHGSHALQYKRVLMGIDIGYYLYSKYTDLSRVYNRISVQYILSRHFLLKMSVKSHMAKADFIEWGIGWYR